MDGEIIGKTVWGEKWNSSMFRAKGLECRCHNFSYWNMSLNRDDEWVKHVVGVDDVGPDNYSSDPDYKHVLIFKCPKCFEYFYFHADINMIWTYLTRSEERR